MMRIGVAKFAKNSIHKVVQHIKEKSRNERYCRGELTSVTNQLIFYLTFSVKIMILLIQICFIIKLMDHMLHKKEGIFSAFKGGSIITFRFTFSDPQGLFQYP